MRRYISVFLLCLFFAVTASGCVLGEIRKPMNKSLFSVLDENAQNFFENYSDDSVEYMIVNYDQHYARVSVKDKVLIRQMVEALSVVKVTDGYHFVSFVTTDGKKYSINFENSVMCVGKNRYILDNTDAFWKLFTSVAAEYSE